MLNFLKSLFLPPPPPSGATAKERLKLVLLSDHLSLAPDVVDSLKRDLLEVISRYVEIDFDHADVTFEQREREVAMLASIPITGVRERPRPEAPELPEAAAPATAAARAEPAVAVLERSTPAEPGDGAPSDGVPGDGAAADSAGAHPPASAPASASAVLDGPPAPASGAAGGGRPPGRRRRRKKAGSNGTLSQGVQPQQPGVAAGQALGRPAQA